MYVVRRSFRNYGKMMSPGSVVEPGEVKRFKSRLNDGHIVEVPQQDFDMWQKYFSERMGVQITLPEEPAQQTEETAQQPEEPAQQPEEPAQQTEETAQQPEEPAQQTEEPAQQTVQVAKVVVVAQ